MDSQWQHIGNGHQVATAQFGVPERAAATAQALAKAGASHIYLAGRPGEMEQTYKAAGIGSFVYVGCDIVALLDDALKLA